MTKNAGLTDTNVSPHKTKRDDSNEHALDGTLSCSIVQPARHVCSHNRHRPASQKGKDKRDSRFVILPAFKAEAKAR